MEEVIVILTMTVPVEDFSFQHAHPVKFYHADHLLFMLDVYIQANVQHYFHPEWIAIVIQVNPLKDIVKQIVVV